MFQTSLFKAVGVPAKQPAVRRGPTPIDASQLHRVSGGIANETSAPKGTWTSGQGAVDAPKGTWV